MTDREMLELAAKAAGMDYLIWTTGAAPCVHREHRIGDRICWHPLTDDGDALRLAVRLRLDVDCAGGEVVVAYEQITHAHAAEWLGTDPYAATRRAIVRAAAAIGRNMT